MLAKFLTTISLIFQPLVFSGEPISRPLSTGGLLDDNNIIKEKIISKKVSEIDKNWSSIRKQHLSSISLLWLTNPNFLPVRDWGIEEPKIEAGAALISNITDDFSAPSKDKILYQKNFNDIFSIASLTKLMTAVIVLENIDLEEEVIVSENAISAYGDKGGLVVNEKITAENLLYALLIESSNDAAVALLETVQTKTENGFVDLMNKKAKELGLKNTYFTDPSGYQADNVSTAEDLTLLVKYIFRHPLIWQISRTPAIDLSSISGEIQHHWTNTNELLESRQDIIGGKTGYTQEARGCFILVTQQSEKDYLVTVILGAQERFLEARKLIEWVESAYRWK